MHPDLEPERLLAAYATGIFPMADCETGELYWLSPHVRGIIELDRFHVPRSLRSVCRSGRFELIADSAFAEVIAGCADRPQGTWISDDIREAYTTLHELGFAHSVEVWQEGRLVGGLYGVALGGAFFGESMFHRVRDASKVALVALVARLRERGFTLLDVQFVTDHLHRFGAVTIWRDDYERRLRRALQQTCRFAEPGERLQARLPPSSKGGGRNASPPG